MVSNGGTDGVIKFSHYQTFVGEKLQKISK